LQYKEVRLSLTTRALFAESALAVNSVTQLWLLSITL